MVLTKAKTKNKEKKSRIKLEQALKRVFEVSTFTEKKYNRKHCRLNLPICFEGKKVMLKLIR